MEIMDFYRGKRVFITGHTGFKGAWLVKMLTMAGAKVTGYALEPPTSPSLYRLLDADNDIDSIIGDIRDFDLLNTAFHKAKPEIVFHLAAQSIVHKGYSDPRATYEINVIGTLNILECIRQSDCVKSFLNVTTDKVYENIGSKPAFDENASLNGFDPYSNSKSCSELITGSYRNSFFFDRPESISTVRAGNAIGGGDFAPYRIIPDCVRAVLEGKDIIIRNPRSIRPYQHVLEPLSAYMMIAKAQYESKSLEGSYNIGPKERDYICTEKLVKLFCGKWGNAAWKSELQKNAPHEAEQLKIDCLKIQNVFGWTPKWSIEKAVEKTVEWTKSYLAGEDINIITEKQINDYLNT